MKHTTSALVFAAAALLAASAQAAPPLMDVAQGAATEAGTPLTLTARAPLTLTVKTLHWSEKTQDFLEIVKLTRKGRGLQEKLSDVPETVARGILCDRVTPETIPGLYGMLDDIIGKLKGD